MAGLKFWWIVIHLWMMKTRGGPLSTDLGTMLVGILCFLGARKSVTNYKIYLKWQCLVSRVLNMSHRKLFYKFQANIFQQNMACRNHWTKTWPSTKNPGGKGREREHVVVSSMQMTMKDNYYVKSTNPSSLTILHSIIYTIGQLRDKESLVRTRTLAAGSGIILKHFQPLKKKKKIRNLLFFILSLVN